MAFAIFGPGSLYVTRTDVQNSTPVNIGYSQEFSLDESAETKELFGQDQYPLVVARGTIKITGKAKAAELSAIAVNNAFHGESAFTTGQILFAPGEAGTIPTGTTHSTSGDTPSGTTLPFSSTTGVANGMSVSGTNIPANTFVASFVANTSVTLTQAVSGDVPSSTVITFGPSIAVTNAANFDTDLGVVYASTGLPLLKVAGSPTTGQYSVISTGTGKGEYSFASADAGIAVLFNYAYTSASGGQLVTVTNKLIGNTPTFQLDYATTLNNNPYYLRLFQCVSSKLSQSFKLVDFSMPELDFSVFANPAGKVYEASYPQVG
jgi:hypothetical protein